MTGSDRTSNRGKPRVVSHNVLKNQPTDVTRSSEKEKEYGNNSELGRGGIQPGAVNNVDLPDSHQAIAGICESRIVCLAYGKLSWIVNRGARFVSGRAKSTSGCPLRALSFRL